MNYYQNLFLMLLTLDILMLFSILPSIDTRKQNQ